MMRSSIPTYVVPVSGLNMPYGRHKVTSQSGITLLTIAVLNGLPLMPWHCTMSPCRSSLILALKLYAVCIRGGVGSTGTPVNTAASSAYALIMRRAACNFCVSFVNMSAILLSGQGAQPIAARPTEVLGHLERQRLGIFDDRYRLTFALGPQHPVVERLANGSLLGFHGVFLVCPMGRPAAVCRRGAAFGALAVVNAPQISLGHVLLQA